MNSFHINYKLYGLWRLSLALKWLYMGVQRTAWDGDRCEFYAAFGERKARKTKHRRLYK